MLVGVVQANILCRSSFRTGLAYTHLLQICSVEHQGEAEAVPCLQAGPPCRVPGAESVPLTT